MEDKSFFKDEDAFVKFSKLPKEERERILKGESVPEVDQILDDVKYLANDAGIGKKKEDKKCQAKKSSQAKL